MRRVLIALALLVGGHTAHAQCSGYFDEAYVSTGYFSSGYLEENDCIVTPDVIGLTQAGATSALQAAGLDIGNVTSRCSIQVAGEVIDQIPPAGTVLPAGYLVDVNVSNGSPCEGQRSRLRLNLEVKP